MLSITIAARHVRSRAAVVATTTSGHPGNVALSHGVVIAVAGLHRGGVVQAVRGVHERAFASATTKTAPLLPPSVAAAISEAPGGSGGGGGWGRTLAKAVAGTAVATVGVVGAAVYYVNDNVGGNDGLIRTAKFYSLAIPKYLEYRAHMMYGSPDDVWDKLHEDTSKAGLDIMKDLKGFYVKSGQMCAANIGNAFPKVWQDTMSVLQDKCPYEPFDVVRSIVESEYGGRPLEDVFETFEEHPMGAASIGQVHRATLKVDGSRVVVKVMYPGVEEIFRGDVRTIKMFAQIAQPVHVPPLIEIEKQFMTEFDYRSESEHLNKVRNNMLKANLSGDPSKPCAIPKPRLDLCTKRVLVMEELLGDKLVQTLQMDAKRLRARFGDAVVEEAFAPAGKKNGPTADEYNVFVRLSEAKRRSANLVAKLHNVCVGWLPGVGWRSYEGRDTLPINHAQLVDDLLLIHGHQVLIDGFFNGDPHPGNILLLGVEEGKPQLGLIDYGQVKSLTRDERLLFAKLIIALADDNREDIVKYLTEAGYRSKRMDPNIMYKFARVAYDEDNEELTEGKHIQIFMEDLHNDDAVDHLPQQYIMASRVSILLRGLGHAVRQSRSVAKAWKGIAEQALREAGEM